MLKNPKSVKNMMAVSLLAAFSTILPSCADRDSSGLPDLDISQLTGKENLNTLPKPDVKMIALATDSTMGISGDVRISGIMGDTVFIRNSDNKSLFLFDLSDGKHISTFNHYGEGPGEYRSLWSVNLFFDKASNSVLVPNIDNGDIYSYSLATDSLNATYNIGHTVPKSKLLGTCQKGIIDMVREENNLAINILDNQFKIKETKEMPWPLFNNFSDYSGTTDGMAVIFADDTLFTATTEGIKPLAILDRGNKELPSDSIRDFMNKMIESSVPDEEVLSPYLVVKDIQYDGKYLLVSTILEQKSSVAIFDTKDGSLKYNHTSGPDWETTLTLDIDGTQVSITRIFTNAGKWYGLLNEVSIKKLSLPQKESQAVLVSFSIPE